MDGSPCQSSSLCHLPRCEPPSIPPDQRKDRFLNGALVAEINPVVSRHLVFVLPFAHPYYNNMIESDKAKCTKTIVIFCHVRYNLFMALYLYIAAE